MARGRNGGDFSRAADEPGLELNEARAVAVAAEIIPAASFLLPQPVDDAPLQRVAGVDLGALRALRAEREHRALANARDDGACKRIAAAPGQKHPRPELSMRRAVERRHFIQPGRIHRLFACLQVIEQLSEYREP